MKVFFAAVVSLVLMSAESGNLIYNGGFELGTDGFALHRIVTRKDRRHLPLELEKADPASPGKTGGICRWSWKKQILHTGTVPFGFPIRTGTISSSTSPRLC